MENIIKFLFKDLKKNQEEECTKIATTFTGVKSISWYKDVAQIEVIWYWNQEDRVRELIEIINTIFGEKVEIKIKNGENKHLTTTHEETTSSIIEEGDKLETAKDFSSNSIKEDNIMPEGIEEIQENSNPISECSIKEEVVTQIPIENSTAPSEEEKKSIPKEEYEEALKELLGSNFKEYDFTTEKAVEEAIKFCSNYEIKGEVLKYALTLVETAQNETVFINALSRILCKNKALAKIELKKAFEKWINTKYPYFVEKYPEVNIYNFLNIFREGKNKF